MCGSFHHWTYSMWLNWNYNNQGCITAWFHFKKTVLKAFLSSSMLVFKLSPFMCFFDDFCLIFFYEKWSCYPAPVTSTLNVKVHDLILTVIPLSAIFMFIMFMCQLINLNDELQNEKFFLSFSHFLYSFHEELN